MKKYIIYYLLSDIIISIWLGYIATIEIIEAEQPMYYLLDNGEDVYQRILETLLFAIFPFIFLFIFGLIILIFIVVYRKIKTLK